MALQSLDQLRRSLYHLDQAASALALVAVLNHDPRSQRLAQAVETLVTLHRDLTALMETELQPEPQSN